ncbi:MAG: flagellar motor switch protein FliN [Candidatus Paracaedimonas acanthamoebae]|uniref:Flagellar motor switch protein FliN n=1 Tax=Candidatus Paracaedimonas acanthamoebae TaxID=244581 RepID=A0A8J7TTE6_9PROT|nr:flagellar motor switch protein FliN [Candidatus Paracaedimonas acanthamoebae]
MNSHDQKKIIKDNRDFINNTDFTPLNDVFFKGSSQQSEKDLHSSIDLKSLQQVPVQVSAVLGQASIPIKQVLKLVPGSIIELDRKVGEPIDIYINNHLLARGNLALIEDQLGITITEIIKMDRD